MAVEDLPSGFQLEQSSPDAPAPQQPSSPDELPHGFQLESEKYGTPGQTAIATLEAAARAATLGGSTIAETALGVPKEEIAGRQEQLSPWLSVPASIAGGAIPVALTGGAAAPAEAALAARGVAPLAARALGYGAEGAIFGAGNVVSDAALGDPNLNAQKILQDVGFGFATSAGLGVLSKTLKAIPVFRRAVENADIPPTPEVTEGPPPPPSGAAPGPSEPPSNLNEIYERNAAGKARGEAVALPQQAVLNQALAEEGNLTNYPFLKPQVDSLASAADRDAWNIKKTIPGKPGEQINNYLQGQKSEIVNNIDKSINSLSPEIEPTPDAMEGGNRTNDIFEKRYSDVQEATKPALQAIKEAGTITGDHLPGVVEAMTNSNSNLANMFDTEGSEIAVKPFSAKMGISQDAYNAVKGVVSDLSAGDTSLQELMNIRNGMGSGIDLTKTGAGVNEVGRLKAAMMSYIENQIQERVPDMEVRAPLRAWAINEGYREAIENGFGASVGKPQVGVALKIVPENINDNIFRNSATVQTAKNFLPPEDFNKIAANWLTEQRAKFTKDGVFSSNKFGTFLKNNQDVLNTAFKENPGVLRQIRNYTTMARLEPDAPHINPSGTAKTFIGALSIDPPKLLSQMAEYFGEKVHHSANVAEVNEMLSGKSEKATMLRTISNTLKRSNKTIESKAKGIFEK